MILDNFGIDYSRMLLFVLGVLVTEILATPGLRLD